MFRSQFALFSSYLVLWAFVSPHPLPARTSESNKPTLKEQVVLLSPGSMVNVQLRNNQLLQGRLGPVTENGFEIQYVKDKKTVSKILNFQDVRSVKYQQHGMSKSTKIVLISLGAFVVVVLIVAAATGIFGES